MENRYKDQYDVIIAGGSYAGLSAAMALGRALKNVIVVDNGLPCNRQTPHSHNFLTNDGMLPEEISAVARFQVGLYPTVSFFNGTVESAMQVNGKFQVVLKSGEIFAGLKLIFATGIKDLLPQIHGLAECWGISVIHCPYCHGYEVRGEITGVLGNGEAGYDFARLISNWTKKLTLFTNGPSALTSSQEKKLQAHGIALIEKEIYGLEHENGRLSCVLFKDGGSHLLKALYAPSPFEQHCKIPQQLGAELTDSGHLKVDGFGETTVKGIYGLGDNASKMRTVANAVAMGTSAGLAISKQMILEDF
jgi:thioredoxin reductase